jgi:hypothetical protein
MLPLAPPFPAGPWARWRARRSAEDGKSPPLLFVLPLPFLGGGAGAPSFRGPGDARGGAGAARELCFCCCCCCDCEGWSRWLELVYVWLAYGELLLLELLADRGELYWEEEKGVS